MTAPVAPRAQAAIGRGLLTSVLLHAAALGTVIAVVRTAPHVAPRAVYRVALVAAPPAPGPVGSAPATPGHTAGANAPATASAPASAPTAAKPAAAKPAAAKPAAAKPAAAKPAAAKPAAAKPSPPKVPTASRVEPHSAPVTPTAKPVGTTRAAPHATPHPLTATPTPPAVAKPTAHATTTPAAKPAAAPTTAKATGKPPAARSASPTSAAGSATTGSAAARGHDPADVRVVGLAFPYPGYLDNLVRQVRLRFSPTQTRSPLRADLAFVVSRDGAVSGIRVVRGSGNYAFDLEAQGAVEAAGEARAFGPLPDGFPGTSLPVTFSFDPRSNP